MSGHRKSERERIRQSSANKKPNLKATQMDKINELLKRPHASFIDTVNFKKLFTMFGDIEHRETNVIEFLKEYDILKRNRFCLDGTNPCNNCLEKLDLKTIQNCPIDKRLCSNILNYKASMGGFRCQRKNAHFDQKERKLNVRHGTFFHGTRTKLSVLLVLIYCFAYDISYVDTLRECRGLSDDPAQTVSKSTIAASFFRIREVIFLHMTTKTYTTKMGGPGKIIEVDETRIGHRKFERGRLVHGRWLLGLIERGENEFRCFEVDTRDKDTLAKIILDNVVKGSTVHTDGWRAYNALRESFKHGIVNHSKNFISPEGGVHTQKIESQWRVLKRFLNGKQKREDLDLYLAEYMFKRMAKVKNKDTFIEILKAISMVDKTVDLTKLSQANDEMVSLYDTHVEDDDPDKADHEEEEIGQKNIPPMVDQWLNNILQQEQDGRLADIL